MLLTAQPRVAETKATDWSSSVVLEVCAAQVVPPLLVATMVPLSPTAQPCRSPAKSTPWRSSLVVEVCAVHVTP